MLTVVAGSGRDQRNLLAVLVGLECHLTRLLDAVPLKRMGTIDEVAELCAFLASDRASYITGQAINIGGGLFTEL